jgi:hypothetical protein
MALVIFAALCGVGCTLWLIVGRDWDALAAVVSGIGVFLFPPAFLIAFIVSKMNDGRRQSRG